MSSTVSWESHATPWTPLHEIKQEPMEQSIGNEFVSSHSEGFHSSSPSCSSRGSPPVTCNPNLLTPPRTEASPENQNRTSAQPPMPEAETPPKSRSASPSWRDNSDDMPSPGRESPDADEEPGLRIPAVNSHGKVKTFKCKQCEFIAVTKLDFWEHSRAHIKPERMLMCPKCPFVTEYKHHLEYHMRNHFGSKPFQCSQCAYSCVNKSMLNSHLKSHSNIYQYRCANCNYATKYCHSLKLHLRKYQHQPAMVLNQDGTPNPLPIIDVYGTRRGPKQKPQNKEEPLNNNNIPQPHPIFPNPFGINFPYGPLIPHPIMFTNNNNLTDSLNATERPASPIHEDNPQQAVPNLSPHLHAMHRKFFSEYNSGIPNMDMSPIVQLSPPSRSPRESLFNSRSQIASPYSPYPMQTSSPLSIREEEEDTNALDLTRSSKLETPPAAPVTPPTTLKNRRKGRAYKLERSAPRVEQSEASNKYFDDVENVKNKVENLEIKIDVQNHIYEAIKEKFELENEAKMMLIDENKSATPTDCTSTTKEFYDCTFCDIVFKDIIMYTMHMGYHGFQDPFTCNMCGQKSADKVSFFVHIARSQHS